MSQPINKQALSQIFETARSHSAWRQEPVPASLMEAVYDLAKMGPTSANCSPARYVFISSPQGKARLKPFLSDGNVEKTMTAPWVVIIAHDLHFADKLPELFPHDPSAKSWFSDDAIREATAFRNGTLSGAYLMLAARALGLDCGPMSGFDAAGVDQEFFAGNPETRNWRSNWLCNIGYGDASALFPRSPRLDFKDACLTL